jgi:hypothetical protein
MTPNFRLQTDFKLKKIITITNITLAKTQNNT